MTSKHEFSSKSFRELSIHRQNFHFTKNWGQRFLRSNTARAFHSPFRPPPSLTNGTEMTAAIFSNEAELSFALFLRDRSFGSARGWARPRGQASVRVQSETRRSLLSKAFQQIVESVKPSSAVEFVCYVRAQSLSSASVDAAPPSSSTPSWVRSEIILMHGPLDRSKWHLERNVSIVHEWNVRSSDLNFAKRAMNERRQKLNRAKAEKQAPIATVKPYVAQIRVLKAERERVLIVSGLEKIKIAQQENFN